MSEFVAGAFVDVRPDTKGFREELKTKVNASIKSAGVFKIPIELDPKRFKSTVNAAAKQATAKVPIVPSTSVADLRTQIQAKLNSAVKGLKISVPIEIQQTGAGSRGGGTGTTTAAATGAAAAGSAAGTKKAAVAASKELTAAEVAEAAAAKALKKAEDELLIANSLIALSTEANVSAEERAQRLGEARAATTRSAAAANKVLAISEAELAVSESAALESARAEALVLRSSVTEKQKELGVNTAKANAEIRSAKAREAAVAAMGVEVKEIGTLNDLHLVENELLSVEARLKRQTTAARDLGVGAIVKENEALLAQIALQKEQIVTQRNFLKGESVNARQQKTAARGFAATGLSLLGIRGATLAASSAFLVGAVSAAVFAKAVKSFADFETELNVFQATANATATQMQQVAAEAKLLGRDITLPGVSAADAAQAMTELARAGLSVRDSIAGARGVLQLAAAAQISNADAATLAASALNAFGLSGDRAVHVADLLANAANASQGSISEMGAALQQASAIARQVGFSLDDTVATLTIFARNGLRGSDAGTSLRTALSRLIAPTKKASDLIQGLGLNLRDAQGNLRPDIFAQFGVATANLTPELRDMIAETIAGQDAIRAFSIGAREGAKGLKLAQLQMKATGSAAALAAARSKGLAGAFSALASNSETLGTTLGKLAAGPIKGLVSGFNQILTDLNALTSGDFDTFFGNLGSEFGDIGKGAKQTGDDFNDFLSGITDFDPGRSLKGLKGLAKGGLLSPAKGEKEEVQALREELSGLQNLRVAAFQQGFNISPITDKIKALQTQLREARVDAGDLIPVTKLEKQLAPLQDIYDQAVLASKALHDRGEDTTFVDQVATDALQKMNRLNIAAHNSAKKTKSDIQKELSGVKIADTFTAEFKLIGQNVDLATPEVLGGLTKLAAKIKGTAPLSGAAGAAVGKKLMSSLNAAITNAVKEDNPEVAAALKALAEKVAALFGGSLGTAFKNIKVPLTDDELTAALLPAQIRTARAEAFGTVGDQISGKQGELKQLQTQLGEVVKGSEQEKKVLDDISSVKGEIRSLREGEATKEKEANAKSDKKVTDALSDEERGLNQGLEKARATTTLKDDIRRQLALRAFFTREIATIKSTVKDAEKRRDAIGDAEDKLFNVEQDITESRAGRRAQVRDAQLKPLDDAAERAGETETLKDDLKQAHRKVRFWKTQVKQVTQLVKDRKATGEELKTANDALDEAEQNARQVRKDRRDQIRDAKQQGFELDIEFAQTNENKAKETRARQAFIRFLEQQKKHFKGNVNKLKELRNEIAAQKKAIKDLEDDTDESKGTTVFELLQEAADVFRENAGSAITPAQPFAGPAGFVSNIANFIRRQQKKQAGDAIKPGVKKPLDKVVGLSAKPLIGPDDVVDPEAFTTLGKLKEEVKRLFLVGHPKGLLRAGNIDLLNRPSVRNPKGGRSTVFSETIGVGDAKHPGLTAVIPRVIGNTPSTKGQKARLVSEAEARRHFQQTGENLGIFSSLKDAEIYSELLHEQQARLGLKGRTTQAVNPLADGSTTTAVDRNRVSVDRLTTSVDRLANVLDRQPGTGKANIKKPAGIERSERNHFAIATATRRVVENRTGV